MPTSEASYDAIFCEALDIESPERRQAFLDQACQGDAELRRKVQRLLDAHLKAGNFLIGPAVGVTVDVAPIAERPGSQIGPYKLREQIGEGGFGVVYVAEQEKPVRRKVALKIIKPGMDTKDVIARFEAERQALALMDHPNVARVLDAGATESGRPYFVMELVHGVPITEFCDKNKLCTRDRLLLFADVCRAVQHAHQKGIIHRDLKPSNIMVTLHDGKPVAKVIDFGVSKALSQQLTEKSIYTAYGQMIGTPSYMSPEQAEMSGLGIDTRSDIYSLGVLLYELLTGKTPLDAKRLRASAYAEILRIIKEEEPPKPSLKISTLGEEATVIAEHRHTDPKQLRRSLRGELDWIVMKCLEKDRARRYETAGALARDIERYLHDEPVEACPPSAAYRLRKLSHKHRTAILTAAAIAGLLVVGSGVSTWQAVRATVAEGKTRDALLQVAGERDRAIKAEQAIAEQRDRAVNAEQEATAARRRADEEKQSAQAVRDFLQNDLLRMADVQQQADALVQSGGDFTAAANPTVSELLDRAAAELTPEKIERKLPGQPLVQAEILRTIGDTYRGTGEHAKAIAHLQRSADLYLTHLGPDHLETLTTMCFLGMAYRGAGRQSEAIRLLEQVRDKAIETLGPDDPGTLYTLNQLAGTYRMAGQVTEAIRLLEQVRDTRVAKLGLDHRATLGTLSALANAYRSARRLPEAIRLLEQVRDKEFTKLGPDHPETLNTLHSLAWSYQDAGRLSEAIQVFEQVRDRRIEKLGPDHPDTLFTLKFVAGSYVAAGRLPEAARLLEQVREKQVAKLGPDHPQTLITLHILALTYQSLGHFDRSIPIFEETLRRQSEKMGTDHPLTMRTAFDLGANYRDDGRHDDAVRIFDDWLPRAAKVVEPAPSLNRNSYLSAGAEVYTRAGRHDQAELLLREAADLTKQHAGPDSLPYAQRMTTLGLNLLRQKKWADAEPVFRECLAIHEAQEPDAWYTFSGKSLLGGALLGQQKYAEAEPLLLSGYQALKQRAATVPVEKQIRMSEALGWLVQLYEATGKQGQAANWRRELEAAPASSNVNM
jgi:serine/threonine protein kinase